MDTALVTLSQVSAGYGRRAAVENIDLRVDQGDFIAIVGPSGAGKTTLLRVIAGALSPAAGVVTSRPSLRVGYVPQVETVNWFFPVTVGEVVGMARQARRLVPWPSPEDRTAVTRALARLALDTVAERHISELSGGQQQRAFIARALTDQPDLLLLDEPSSGIDAASRHDLIHLLHDLHHEGTAIVTTTHDLNGLAAHVPTVACLNRSLIATGPPSQVFSRSILEATYGAKLDVLSHAGMPVVVDPITEVHHEHPS